MSVAVVHLVRQANGVEPFEAFLDSYRCHDAAHPHELVLLFKGFDSPQALEPFRRLTRGLDARETFVSDQGWDITAYMAAARQLRQDRVCFLNSYSAIVADGWLGLLSGSLRPGVGVVGASGSWASIRSLALWSLRLPNAYRTTLRNRQTHNTSMPPSPYGRGGGTLTTSRLRTLKEAPKRIVTHPGFPSPHVRTNAFLIDRELLLSLQPRRLATGMDTHRFECGYRSMTTQLSARGLASLVVGRDGEARPSDRWPEADVFWQGGQRDLLVADNQTRSYERATPEGRDFLARLAWGDHARPD